MILYIHGFGSCGKGNKANILHESLDRYSFITPSLSHIPELAINTLEQLIQFTLKYENVYLMGSSLGGYYSIYLASKYNLKAVVINPAITPYITLEQAFGRAFNYHDLSTFEWNQSHTTQLKNLEVDTINPNNFMLLTQTGDELLDYKDGVKKLSGAKQIVIEGGNHGFENIEHHIEDIITFFELI